MKTEQCKVFLTSKQKLKLQRHCHLNNVPISIFLEGLINQFFDRQTEHDILKMKLKIENL